MSDRLTELRTAVEDWDYTGDELVEWAVVEIARLRAALEAALVVIHDEFCGNGDPGGEECSSHCLKAHAALAASTERHGGLPYIVEHEPDCGASGCDCGALDAALRGPGPPGCAP